MTGSEIDIAGVSDLDVEIHGWLSERRARLMGASTR
jgi:hypothetical protein